MHIIDEIPPPYHGFISIHHHNKMNERIFFCKKITSPSSTNVEKELQLSQEEQLLLVARLKFAFSQIFALV
jgi:hypothetical protein